MGMSLSSIETKAEQDCILDHNKSRYSRLNNFPCFYNLPPIDFMQLKESSFWTSATSRSCDKKFFWCSGPEIPTDNKIHTWSPPNPNFVPGENCVLHKFDFGNLVTIDGFEDNVCTGENLYLCEEGAATGGNTSTNTSSRKFKIAT